MWYTRFLVTTVRRAMLIKQKENLIQSLSFIATFLSLSLSPFRAPSPLLFLCLFCVFSPSYALLSSNLLPSCCLLCLSTRTNKDKIFNSPRIGLIMIRMKVFTIFITSTNALRIYYSYIAN